MTPTAKLYGKMTGPGGMGCPCCAGPRKSRKVTTRRVRAILKREAAAEIAAAFAE